MPLRASKPRRPLDDSGPSASVFPRHLKKPETPVRALSIELPAALAASLQVRRALSVSGPEPTGRA